jgi:hypothetical protein
MWRNRWAYYHFVLETRVSGCTVVNTSQGAAEQEKHMIGRNWCLAEKPILVHD